MRYASKWPQYRDQWNAMVITPSRIPEFEKQAHFAIAHKATYTTVENATGVRWYHVAVIHQREASGNFAAYLGNGQWLGRVTTIVPKGRGPFLGPDAFVKGCIDALRIDGLSSVKDWRLEKILYYCEIFNGSGYDMRGLPSPYVWGGTNIQRPGKFVRDGVFSRTTWDTQPGCAPLLWMISQIDHSVVFVRED